MAFNLSTKGDTRRVSIGGGLLRMRPWDGTTPTTTDDIGYGKGGQIQATRTKSELKLGVPRNLIVQYAIEEEASLSFTGVEWNPARIQDLLGAGAVSTQGNMDVLKFGGTMAFEDLSVSFRHEFPKGGGAGLTIDMFRAQGNGEFNVTFGDDFQEIPYQFRALSSATEYGGAPIATDGALFRLMVQYA